MKTNESKIAEFDLEDEIGLIIRKYKDLNTATAASSEFARGFNKAKALYEPRWISVEEALPEQHKFVLVYIENGISPNGSYCIGCSFVDFLQNQEWQKSKGVTHWMPLPAQPKAEGSHD